MRFYVDTDERQSMRVTVQEVGKTVNIVGQDADGQFWTLITFLPDGTFKRGSNIPPYLGLQLGKGGRIVETLSKDVDMLKKFNASLANVGFDTVLSDTKEQADEIGSFETMKNQILKIQGSDQNGNRMTKKKAKVLPIGFNSTSGHEHNNKFITMSELEELHIHETLEATNGNQQKAAKILGIGLRTLNRKLSEQRARGGNNGGGRDQAEHATSH